jgi:hypothetical protein
MPEAGLLQAPWIIGKRTFETDYCASDSQGESGIVRIAIVGTHGRGKDDPGQSTRCRLALPHIELDVLHWNPDARSLVTRRWLPADAHDGFAAELA